MSIPHLKARAEFYALCLEHGPENVEYQECPMQNYEWYRGVPWILASDADPNWHGCYDYPFRLRPRTVVLPEAVVPKEDPEGLFVLRMNTFDLAKDGSCFKGSACPGDFRYRTAGITKSLRERRSLLRLVWPACFVAFHSAIQGSLKHDER